MTSTENSLKSLKQFLVRWIQYLSKIFFKDFIHSSCGRYRPRFSTNFLWTFHEDILQICLKSFFKDFPQKFLRRYFLRILKIVHLTFGQRFVYKSPREFFQECALNTPQECLKLLRWYLQKCLLGFERYFFRTSLNILPENRSGIPPKKYPKPGIFSNDSFADSS